MQSNRKRKPLSRRVFAALYDFVFGGGLKKTLVAVFLISMLGLSVAYLVYPQTVASVAMGTLGMAEQDFTPPEIEEGEEVFEYEGTWSGSGGPVGTSIGGDVHAVVDWEAGEVSAEMEGDEVSEGYMEGSVDPETGVTEGEGAVDAFGMSGVSFEIEGEYDPEGTTASGEWESTGEISGSGTWDVEMTEESR
ncbi:MAG: hypothetical protein ACLFMT_01330, partial [Halobacteriales archaeon]